MSNYYPENSVGRYLRDHDFAMLHLKSLFTVTSEGNVEFVDPQAGLEQATEIIEGMANYPDGFIKIEARVQGFRTLHGPRRWAETMMKSKGEGDEELNFGELQVDFGAARQRRDYWDEAAADIEGALDFIKPIVKEEIMALKAA